MKTENHLVHATRSLHSKPPGCVSWQSGAPEKVVMSWPNSPRHITFPVEQPCASGKTAPSNNVGLLSCFWLWWDSESFSIKMSMYYSTTMIGGPYGGCLFVILGFFLYNSLCSCDSGGWVGRLLIRRSVIWFPAHPVHMSMFLEQRWTLNPKLLPMAVPLVSEWLDPSDGRVGTLCGSPPAISEWMGWMWPAG